MPANFLVLMMVQTTLSSCKLNLEEFVLILKIPIPKAEIFNKIINDPNNCSPKKIAINACMLMMLINHNFLLFFQSIPTGYNPSTNSGRTVITT
jgi:hypothetical protein